MKPKITFNTSGYALSYLETPKILEPLAVPLISKGVHLHQLLPFLKLTIGFPILLEMFLVLLTQEEPPLQMQG